MITLEELISVLTPEELEKHRDLILECRNREEEINSIGDTLRDNVEKFTRISAKLLVDLEKLSALTDDIISIKDKNNKTENIANEHISSIPDDKFYHA